MLECVRVCLRASVSASVCTFVRMCLRARVCACVGV